MKNNLKKTIIFFVVSLSVLTLIIFALEFFRASTDSETEKTLCLDSQRNAENCIQFYSPVCGWNDPEKIQCIKYPCAQTYSNSCFACSDENVQFWTEGECPK